MKIEQERAELLPCPFCGGSVSFHQDDEECRDGCHYIECKTCGTFDLSTAADPTNTVEDLGELRARIAPLWSRRAALQSQAREDVKRLDWLEEQAQTSRYGVSIDYVYVAEDGYVSEKGYRFMRHRFIGPLGKSAREAIDHARRAEGGNHE